MNDLDRALTDIADIRNQVAETRLFRGFGPLVIGATGLLALGLAALQTVAQSSGPDVLTAWVALAILSAGLIGAEMWALSKRAHGARANSLLWVMIQKFLPVGLAGGSIGWVILTNAPHVHWILPGLWQVLIALGLFAALPMLPKPVMLVAAWYLLAGLTALLLATQNQAVSPWSMGLPFGFGQLSMAALLHASQRSSNAAR